VERDKYNDALCKVIILSDITEVERAKNLMESALEQAMAANQAKSNFLSTMSHEMRTPMNAIIGMTKIGKRADGIDEKNHALNRIGEASSHLLGVINDVLDMAKIEADKLVLDPVEYSFERMIKKVVSFINFRVDEKQQVFSVDVDSNIPRFIIGDDLRLAQVLTNLMSNAVKFTPEGGRVFLSASLICATNDTCELCFKVADSGIGIPYERQTGIFESFEQATDGTSREYGGTGLGLAISKRIVELMGGKIWVESKPGEGAAFSFTVKLQICKKDDIYCSDEDTCDSPMEVGEFVRKRMLLAEDIEVNREIMLSLLEDTGIMIDCVDNGKDAFRIIEESADKYDIVLMDVQMPQMDGLEATRHIRALPDARAAKLPIIAMTANVFKDDIEACLAAGMDGHLGKPIDSDKVMGVLRKYLISESGKAVINTDFHS